MSARTHKRRRQSLLAAALGPTVSASTDGSVTLLRGWPPKRPRRITLSSLEVAAIRAAQESRDINAPTSSPARGTSEGPPGAAIGGG